MREGEDATRKITPATLIIFVLLAGLAAGAAVFLLRELGSQGPVNVVVLKSESSSFKQKPEAEPEDKSAGAQSSVMNMLDDIQENKQDKIFILSLKAAGTGLNLTAASHVIHYDLWWNPAVETQATDRAYRIGQKKNVQVYRFITKGTLEEKIDAMIQSKRKLADMTVATGDKWIGDLSSNELDELVQLEEHH